MSDLISRSALDESIRNRVRQLANAYGWGDEYVNGFDESLVYVARAPAVDAVPVVHARWIHDINNLYGCSACLERETMSHKKMKRFCPNCGAKMDGGAEA